MGLEPDVAEEMASWAQRAADRTPDCGVVIMSTPTRTNTEWQGVCHPCNAAAQSAATWIKERVETYASLVAITLVTRIG